MTGDIISESVGDFKSEWWARSSRNTGDIERNRHLYDGDALLGIVKPFGERDEVLLLPSGQAIEVGRERSDRAGIYQRTKAIRDAWARRRHPVAYSTDGDQPFQAIAITDSRRW
ncbi:hypothetical protein [Bradyrhizobium elkanii]|uniref:hypothetical protein n=1 Tax=Bradyrhizobium elkanii TaxID=29448 RepID=UPI0022275883|nr:hypothetical protein [Bradyrhizobium elkanii]MCW2130674.1 hypothetical protein [Bradyrhizobium elkanii]MCW2176025.1 hypothetical protein [Bradyrhizobium elkanii]